MALSNINIGTGSGQKPELQDLKTDLAEKDLKAKQLLEEQARTSAEEFQAAITTPEKSLELAEKKMGALKQFWAYALTNPDKSAPALKNSLVKLSLKNQDPTKAATSIAMAAVLEKVFEDPKLNSSRKKIIEEIIKNIGSNNGKINEAVLSKEAREAFLNYEDRKVILNAIVEAVNESVDEAKELLGRKKLSQDTSKKYKKIIDLVVQGEYGIRYLELLAESEQQQKRFTLAVA